MAKLHVPVCGVRNHCIRRILDLHRDIEIIEDPAEQRHGADPFHLDIQKAVHRHVHFPQKSDQDRDISDGKIIPIADHQDTARQIDQHRADTGKCGQHHPEPAAGHTLPDIETDHPVIDLFVPVIFFLLFSEQFHQQLSADGQCLIENTVDLVMGCL